MNRLARDSLILLVLNQTAAGLHYVFQVIAAQRLDIRELADLNSGMTAMAIALSLALLAQYYPVFMGVRHSTVRAMRKVTLGIWVMAALFFSGWAISRPGQWPPTLFLVGVPGFLAVHFWAGCLQRRERFIFFGILFFALAVVKATGAFLSSSIVGFGYSVILPPLLLIPVAYWLGQRNRYWDQEPDLADSQRSVGSALFSLFVVGLSTNLFPAVDFINIRTVFGTDIAGYFTRIQLFSKIVYFAPAALLQVSLPRYVKALESPGDSSKSIREIRKIEMIGIVACYAVAGFFYLVGDQIGSKILKIPNLQTIDLFLACLSVVPLYGVLCALQIFSAGKKMKVMVLFPVLVCLIFGLAQIIPFESLQGYLIFSATYFSVIGWSAWIWAGRWVQRRYKTA